MGCLAFQHLVGLNVNNSFLYQVFCPTKDLTWRTCEFVLMELHSKSILLSGTWLKECLMKAGIEDVNVEFVTGSSSHSGKEKAMSNFRTK